MIRKFNGWYTSEIGKALDEGQDYRNIEIPLRLSALKPLHANWLVELYDFLTSQKGKDIIVNGWKAEGITQAVESGSNRLPYLDPFEEIDPMDYDGVSLKHSGQSAFEAVDCDYATCCQSGELDEHNSNDEEEEYYNPTVEDSPEEEGSRNIFEIIDDEMNTVNYRLSPRGGGGGGHICQNEF